MSAGDTPLARELKDLIAAEGPIPVSRYMALCLGHPRHGYYMAREPFGAAGDFVTAPEISQVFGELIGAWVAGTWEAMGRPSPLRLVELGPGRGTLMADMARAARAMRGLADALDIHLVETAPRLRERQRQTLADAGIAASWHDDLAAVPAGATLLVANEFLDALPIRQLVMTEHGWRERVVGLDTGGALAFGLAPDPVPPTLVPEPLRAAARGSVFELCPAFEGLAATLAARAAAAPLAALFIDYGHLASAHGDTLQAVKAHAFTDPLAEPGLADLTAHVDFAAFARAAGAAGLALGPPVTQRELLFRLGLAARAEALARSNPDAFETIRAGAERLVDPAPAAMGALFKAMLVHSPGLRPLW